MADTAGGETYSDAFRLKDPAQRRGGSGSTYDDPRQSPVGILYVLVNGQVAVDRERCPGVMACRAVP